MRTLDVKRWNDPARAQPGVISVRRVLTGLAILALAGLGASLLVSTRVSNRVTADSITGRKIPPPNQIGAWFGIARPCPTDPVADSPEHAAFCRVVCGACPNTNALPPEVPMMPTLLADGTVLADDAVELVNPHTTAYGKWIVSENDGLPDRPGTQRFKATFFWLGGSSGVPFSNAMRLRFVTYFDPADPDRMIGFIQPFLFPFAPEGTVIVLPPTDPFAGDHIPALDLLAPLPSVCTPENRCLGTYHFVIRRIKAE
jgi:hypothetical protein